MFDGETSIYTRSNYRKAIGTLYCTLENGSDLYVNGHQKARHYCAWSTEKEERRRMPNYDFYFTRRIYKLLYCAMLYTHSIENQP